MAVYWIDCANLAKEHSHVTSDIARMWVDDGSDGGSWRVPETLSVETVIAMIDTGDEFSTRQRRGGDVSVSS